MLEEFLNSHRSVRTFSAETVSEDILTRIIRISHRAPTSSNLQMCSIVVVRNSDTKATLAELCGGQAHVANCPVFLIFLADLYPLSELCRVREYPFKGDYLEPFLLATIDAALCAGRALTGAEALGFGGVLVGGIRNNPEEVSQLLDLPQFCYPVCGFSLGKPASEGNVKPRIPDYGLTHFERYDRSAHISAIEEYDQTISATGLYKDRKVALPEGAPEDSDDREYSWSEHSARRISSAARGALRPGLRAFLERKGFTLK